MEATGAGPGQYQIGARSVQKEELESGLASLVAKYGEWTYDIPLPHGVWTRGHDHYPHTRLKRIVQIAADLSHKPLSDCRVLDLGCLEGQFAIEFALHGASVVAIEARVANIEKARFAKHALQLDKLHLIQDDVRNVKRYGEHDVVVCSGILYHLNDPDVFYFLDDLYRVTRHLLIIDTHVCLTGEEIVTHAYRAYTGARFDEHAADEVDEVKESRLWSSWGNNTSFVFTRPSLVNYLAHAGFSSIYECFNPPHLNFGRPGLEHNNRCTFVAIKGNKQKMLTSPLADELIEDHPEGSLSYPNE